MRLRRWSWLRLVFVAVVGLYTVALAAMVIFQRDFIFDREDSSYLEAAGTLAIEGSTRVTIPTSDGEKLAGWYLPPKDASAPVFLFFHGKGGGLERKSLRWAKLKDRGAGVLAFSYRGFPGSTGKPSEAGLYEDARAAYRWLTGRHDATRIVLHGLSLGTAVAAKLATEANARALVLEAPYSALVDVAAERQPWFPVSVLLQDQFRTRDFIADIKMPLLIAHGDEDRSIPLDQARELYALAPEPKKLVVKPGSGHETLVRDGLYDDVWQFLDSL